MRSRYGTLIFFHYFTEEKSICIDFEDLVVRKKIIYDGNVSCYLIVVRNMYNWEKQIWFLENIARLKIDHCNGFPTHTMSYCLFSSRFDLVILIWFYMTLVGILWARNIHIKRKHLYSIEKYEKQWFRARSLIPTYMTCT